jgi:hypothetical protein
MRLPSEPNHKLSKMFNLKKDPFGSSADHEVANKTYRFEVFHPVCFYILDVFSITPIECIFFIYYISIPYSSYMFRCVSLHLRGELIYCLLNSSASHDTGTQQKQDRGLPNNFTPNGPKYN